MASWRMTSGLLAMFCAMASPLRGQSASAADELNLGVEAYRQARYDSAIQHFQKALGLDPEKAVAHLYLASTYAKEYIPGVDTPENKRLAEQAIGHYRFVLDSDAEGESRIDSAKGTAWLYFNLKKFDDARKFDEMAADLDPNDPDPHYSIGVIDWTKCYQVRMESRSKLNLKPEEALDAKNKEQKKACDELKLENGSTIEDGIENLNKAIELRPDHDDAMAYMNLMYRERADIECDDPAAREQDLKTADEWVDKTLAVKKAQAEAAEKRGSAPNPEQK